MKTQRITALFLILALLFTACLFSSCQTVEPPAGEDPTDAATTEEATTEAQTGKIRGGKKEKLPNTTTLDQNFLTDCVIVGIQPYASDYEYTPESFSEVGCLDIMYDWRFDDRHLALKVKASSKSEIIQMLDLLLKREDVWYAHPDYIMEPYGIEDMETDEPYMTLPTDDVYMDDDETNNWSLEKIMMPDAWDYTTGSSTIKVGIIDSGIDETHPDLDERVNTDLSYTFSGTSNPLVDDSYDSHGTGVAGIIGAEANNQSDGENTECVGICWNVQLVSLKVAFLDENGIYLGFRTAAVVEAIEYATENDIDVLNFSGGGPYDAYWTSVMSDAIENYPGVFVCAAGNGYVDNNNDDNPIYPGNFDFTNLITVSSSTVNDYAFAGAHEGQNSVDIYAPGVDIYTTQKNGENVKVRGTSIAAPHVAGVAALMLSYDPNLSPAQVKAIIMNTADTVYKNERNEFGSLCVSGGRLNAYNAIEYVATHLANHNSFVVSDSRNDALEHDWVCSCGDRLPQRHSHSEETHIGSSVYHRLVCICGDWTTEPHTFEFKNVNNYNYHRVTCAECLYISTDAHAFEAENVNNLSYHKVTCEECSYTTNVAHTWELNYVNPNSAQASAYAVGGGNASIQAIPVYTCSGCGYVSYTTPPDY